MEEDSTKVKIQQVALDLFAKFGYRAVSIRDIGKQVGIKESSIYYHYKNKQDILDSIFEQVDVLVDNMKLKFNVAFTKIDRIDESEFAKVAVGVLNNYLLQPQVYRLISMLTIEKMSDGKAADAFQRLVFELPLEQQETVFRMMCNRKFIKPQDPKLLATQYYAIIYLAFQKNCLVAEVTEEDKQKAAVEVYTNVLDFYRRIREDKK